jgi:hypothetical protein
MGKASGWLIIVGCVMMMLGLCFLPAAFGPHADQSMLAGGVAMFAFGTLICSGGIYLKARVLQSTAKATIAAKSQPKRQRGGCDMCGFELPVIHCRVHQMHICGNCVADHYDFRSCAYVPSTRRSVPSKPAGRFAAKA